MLTRSSDVNLQQKSDKMAGDVTQYRWLSRGNS
jgi:hypothetical protein